MIEELKKFLYFPIASYFKFFAAIRLRHWQPKIVVVTGSSGKTTLLHLLESQIGNKAKYSHHANSSFGIPFDILDLKRKSLLQSEWIGLFLQAPLAAYKAPPKEKIYVVEADCDRPGEGKFLGSLVKPDMVLWLNVSRTHSMNFDNLVSQKKFAMVDDAIAYEYGFLLAACQQYAILNGDLPLERDQIERTKAKVVTITKKAYLKKYEIDQDHTKYVISDNSYAFPALLPEEVFYSIAMCKEVIKELGLPFDQSFSRFVLPPGRSTLFKGIQNTILIDSSYNANLSSIKALLLMYEKFPAKKKWVVIGDMLELGKLEKAEHEELADILSKLHLEKIILLGSRTAKYTAKRLQELGGDSSKIVSFHSLKEVDAYIHDTLKVGEVILFKGSQSMLLEGVIERLLKHKEDATKLPRREAIWEKRRKQKLESE